MATDFIHIHLGLIAALLAAQLGCAMAVVD